MTSRNRADILRALAADMDVELLVSEGDVSRRELREALLEGAKMMDETSEKLLNLIIHIDGASRGNPGHSSAGVVIDDDEGHNLAEDFIYLGKGTNNTAEYGALVHALEKSAMLKADTLLIYSDSELVVKQMQGLYRVKEPKLQTLFFKARSMLDRFRRVEFRHIPRKENRRADMLANQALDEYINKNRK